MELALADSGGREISFGEPSGPMNLLSTRRRWIFAVSFLAVFVIPLVVSEGARMALFRVARKIPGASMIRARSHGLMSWMGLMPRPRKPLYADSTLGPGLYAINVGMNTDWSTDGAWVDARNSLRRWGRAERPWLEKPNLELSAEGYPLSDAGTLSYLRGYPDGRYLLSYEGTGRVTVGGMGALFGLIEMRAGVHTGIVSINHAAHDLFTLAVTTIDPDDPVRNLRLIRPGYPADTKQVFADPFLRRLQPFSTVRVMDWTCVNRLDVRHWKERVRPETFLRTGPDGVSYEDIICLSNESSKDIWLTIPEGSTDEYSASLAKMLRLGLDPGRRIYLELGNELWNRSFPQARRLAVAASDDPDLTRKDDFGRAGEKAAKRLREVAAIFRAEFGKESNRIVAVLCGQSANPYFLSCGLEYLARQPGVVRDAIEAIAIAPYLTLPHSTDKAGLTQDALFTGLDRFLKDDLTGWIAKHAELAGKYELPLIAYEGGQHLAPWNSADRLDVNEEVKRSAQDDPRMGDLYRRLDRTWAEHGGGLFAFYALTSSYGNGGFWGLLADQTSPGSIKWDAALSVALPAGDVTLDRKVDMADFRVIAAHFGRRKSWREQGDLDRDGEVGAKDLALFRANAKTLTAEELAIVAEFAANQAKP